MSGPTITVCRGCCCGTEKKSPGTDHAGLLARIEAAAGDGVTVRISDCLGPCERADVVVVSPSREGRAVGARTVWVSRVTSEVVVDALVEWARSGGPGVAEALPPVQARTFRLERAQADGPT